MSHPPFLSRSADKVPSTQKRNSFVRVSSMSDLSRITADQLQSEEGEEPESELLWHSFEEVPGAWTGGIDILDNDGPTKVEKLKKKANCRFVSGYVFGLLTFIGALFFTASLFNGGLPRYGVEQAENIVVPFNQSTPEIVNGNISTDITWKYYRFQTHHQVENITVSVQVVKSDAYGNVVAPLAVYLSVNVAPTQTPGINETAVLEGGTMPSGSDAEYLLSDQILVCGPRTVYIGLTFPYWSPFPVANPGIPFELYLSRTASDDEQTCHKYSYRSDFFVYLIQPLVFLICSCSCIVCCFSSFIYGRRRIALEKKEQDILIVSING